MRIISGKKRGLKLLSPVDDDVRPTSDKIKGSIFNILADIDENSIVLDLFAGTGSVGIEFLSRGANKVYFCDSSDKSLKIIKENVKKSGFLDSSIIIKKNFLDALDYFYTSKIFFDYIFLDPPYNTNYIEETLNFIYDNNILKEDGILIIETDNEIDIQNFNIIKEKRYSRINIKFLERQ